MRLGIEGEIHQPQVIFPCLTEFHLFRLDRLPEILLEGSGQAFVVHPTHVSGNPRAKVIFWAYFRVCGYPARF